MKEINKLPSEYLPNLGIVLSVFILSLLFYSNPTTYPVKVDRYWVLTAYNEITANTSNASDFVVLKFQDLKKLIFSNNVDTIESEIAAVVL